MTRFPGVLLLSFLGMTATALAGADTNFFSEVAGRFHPSKPSAVMNYDVSYALMSIRLKRVASATMTATEGVWCGSVSNSSSPACMIDFFVATPRGDEGEMSLYKRTVSVLTLPDLKLITYVKQNDEFIKPFFGKGRRMKYTEEYNFEPAAMTYRRHDFVTGTVETNLQGMADLARQSTEVADVIRALYASYQGAPAVGRPVADKIHFNVDGAVRTFDLKMKKGRISVPVLSRKLMALYADIQPGAGCTDRNESFSMWCVPFKELSRETNDPKLQQLAETSLECSMVPLSGEYALFLGSLQCTLATIGTHSWD
ncbi:MAG: hypothetical protein WCO42_02060 [bacterium]